MLGGARRGQLVPRARQLPRPCQDHIYDSQDHIYDSQDLPASCRAPAKRPPALTLRPNSFIRQAGILFIEGS